MTPKGLKRQLMQAQAKQHAGGYVARPAALQCSCSLHIEYTNNDSSKK